MSISDEKSTEAEGRDWDDVPDFDALEKKMVNFEKTKRKTVRKRVVY